MVDAVSWRRTAPLRRGEVAPPDAGVGTRRASASTWLAAAAAAAAAAAIVVAPVEWTLVRVAALLSTCLIAFGGVAERVVAVEWSDFGLIVHRAAVRDQRAPWAGVRELRPPRFPLGRWQIRLEDSAISLMPSDLLGGEGMLTETVRRSGLTFRRGRWKRPKAAPPFPG